MVTMLWVTPKEAAQLTGATLNQLSNTPEIRDKSGASYVLIYAENPFLIPIRAAEATWRLAHIGTVV